VDGSLTRRATVAIIGGSGLYQMLDGGETFEVGTPYGSALGADHDRAGGGYHRGVSVPSWSAS